ncbi:ABC transporter permease [Streptomyces chumphonensis]|uniref:ABC transporter permease n=1 Tax=Streptomyces chumphonensis TaxID=1214925 RepID=UPI003D75FEE1
MFVALRDLRFARGRFALMGVVVTLLATLVVFLHGLTEGLARDSSSAVAGLPVDRIAFGAPGGAEPEVSFSDSTVSAEQVRGWAAADGVRAAEPLGVAMTRLTVRAGAGSVSLFGGPPALLPRLTEGTAPGRDEAAVSAAVAGTYGLAVGDRVRLGTRGLTVSGVTEDRAHAHAPTVWTDLPTWQAVSGHERPTVLVLVLAAGADPHAVDARLATAAVPPGDAVEGIASHAAEQGSLRLVQGCLFVVAALVTGAFFTVWTVQRRPEVAVLKAVGASSGYLVRDALAQALVLLLGGTLLGAGLALVGGLVAVRGVPFVLDVRTAAPPVAAMVVLGLAGAGLAVRRITSVDPLTALGAGR